MAVDTSSAGSSIFEAVGPILDLNEQLIKLVKESARTSLDTFEKAAQTLLELEKSAANSSHLDWLNSLVGAHANLVQGLTDSSLKVAREALK